MSRPGIFLDRSNSYVYEKYTKSLLNDIGVDVSEKNLVPSSKWNKDDKAVAKKAMTVVYAPCIKCGKEMAVFQQDAGFTWCGECFNV
jgi:hypothetical protein